MERSEDEGVVAVWRKSTKARVVVVAVVIAGGVAIFEPGKLLLEDREILPKKVQVLLVTR